jgi:hypothetical protein
MKTFIEAYSMRFIALETSTSLVGNKKDALRRRRIVIFDISKARGVLP